MDNWQYHNKKMIELKKLYNKTNKQTQNRLQEIFDTFNFTFDNIYNIADNKTKKKVDIYIEEWKDKGLLTGYFGMLAKNIYNRTRAKNSEILELLIYGTYIEEQSKIQEQELNIMYDDANYYYKQGQQEVNNALPKRERKPIDILKWALFLALLDQPNAKGYVFEQYIEAIIQFNAQQIYRQAIIDLQQQNKPDITNDIYQNLLKRQGNYRLNVKDGKATSGDVDVTLIGLNNMAKVEGIKLLDKNAECLFISDLCEHVTQMCFNMNGYKFKVDGWNSFDRWYGETSKDLRIERVKVKGLVLGINLPPITHHFHYCHSTITYLPVESREETEYNLDIPRISKEINQVLKNTKLNNNIKKLFNKYLIPENAEIEENLNVPMRYNTDEDKIFINPNHLDFKYYDLSESLTHEIIHMIDARNNISNKLNIDNELRRAELYINSNSDEYSNLFDDNKYAKNMTLSDIFSAVTNNKLVGKIGHDTPYWNEDSSRITKEISANIMSAYLNNNKDTLDIIDKINPLKQIKEKVVKEYGKYTR